MYMILRSYKAAPKSAEPLAGNHPEARPPELEYVPNVVAMAPTVRECIKRFRTYCKEANELAINHGVPKSLVEEYDTYHPDNATIEELFMEVTERQLGNPNCVAVVVSHNPVWTWYFQAYLTR